MSRAGRFGRRTRRGGVAALVSALVVAAVSASQGPGGQTFTTAGAVDRTPTGLPQPAGESGGDSTYYTELPPLVSPIPPAQPSADPTAPPSASANPDPAGDPVPGADESPTDPDVPLLSGAKGARGIPATVLAAYQGAERTVAVSDPGCGLRWQLLAAIGKVESGQARGGRVDGTGTTLTPILGPVLNGAGFAHIRDTDGGAYDGDGVYDRAVGPMQFIPSTWAVWGQDANGDGQRNPNNVFDAALAAGRYLCAGGRDLREGTDLDRAVLSYNRSREYLFTVRSWFAYYLGGAHEVPDGKGPLPPVQPPKPSARPTVSASPKPTPSPKPTLSAKPSASASPSPSPTWSRTASPSPTPSSSVSASPSASASPSPSPTPSPTASPSPTPSSSVSASPSASASPSPSPTPSRTASPSPTPSSSVSASPSASASASPSVSDSPSPSPSPRPSASPSGTVSPTASPSPTASAAPSRTPKPSLTPSPKPEPKPSPKPSPSSKPEPSPTPSPTPAPSRSSVPAAVRSAAEED